VVAVKEFVRESFGKPTRRHTTLFSDDKEAIDLGDYDGHYRDKPTDILEVWFAGCHAGECLTSVIALILYTHKNDYVFQTSVEEAFPTTLPTPRQSIPDVDGQRTHPNQIRNHTRS
jgi:hypothetical protein